MDAKYVKETVGEALIRACSQLSVAQPEDPIDWLASWLRAERKNQLHDKAAKQENEQLQRALQEQQKEQERVKQEEEEKERKEAKRRPNKNEVACQQYIDEVEERAQTIRQELPNKDESSAKCLSEVSNDLSNLQIDSSAISSDQPPPDEISKLIQAGLLLCGYVPDKVDSWTKIRPILEKEYMLRRYQTYELLDKVNDARLQRATECLDGVDFSSRQLQKHALGPLATHFHMYIKFALEAMGKDTQHFFKEEERQVPDPEADDESATVSQMRSVWAAPDPTLNIFGTKSESETFELSVLAGMDSVVLPSAFVQDQLRMDVTWNEKPGHDTDLDASLILFDTKGRAFDLVYHLVPTSQDNCIKHKGDVLNSEAGGTFETFEMKLANASDELSAVAIVLNVATEGDSLQHVRRCGLRLRPFSASDNSDDKAKDLPGQVNFDFSAERISGHEILVGLLHRERDNPSSWRLASVGDVISGPEREKEVSLNFMNALPLAQYYIVQHGILDVQDVDKSSFNPFKMKPGDVMEVPALAMEHPVIIGMGWDVEGELDLDCGIAIYAGKRQVDYCDFEKLVSDDKAITHQGDNRDGHGEGDDETITVEFAKVDDSVDTLFLYAAVYEGGALKDVDNLHIRMLSLKNGKKKEICRFSLDWMENVENDTAVILAKINKGEGFWQFITIGETARGRTVEELDSAFTSHLE